MLIKGIERIVRATAGGCAGCGSTEDVAYIKSSYRGFGGSMLFGCKNARCMIEQELRRRRLLPSDGGRQAEEINRYVTTATFRQGTEHSQKVAFLNSMDVRGTIPRPSPVALDDISVT